MNKNLMTVALAFGVLTVNSWANNDGGEKAYGNGTRFANGFLPPDKQLPVTGDGKSMMDAAAKAAGEGKSSREIEKAALEAASGLKMDASKAEPKAKEQNDRLTSEEVHPGAAPRAEAKPAPTPVVHEPIEHFQRDAERGGIEHCQDHLTRGTN